MKYLSANALVAGIVGACSLLVMGAAEVKRPSVTSQATKITIDYPLQGSVFPPEITPPTFLWRDVNESAVRWIVEVTFAGRSERLRVDVPGAHLKVGEIDTKAGSSDELSQLTPQQMSTRTWRPDSETWEKIKRLSVKSAATIAITGLGKDSELPISKGNVTISTSQDLVGAPIFYRDVPLMLSPPGEKGSIQPLPQSAIPLIKWQIRDISEERGRTVMENLPTCANCHSFSTDGKALGLDVDGPKNDKGLYALANVERQMTIRNQDVIRWSSFQEDPGAKRDEPAVKRFGFMSQVSPNGRYVVTSIGPPAAGNTHQSENPDFAAGLSDRLFSTTYQHLNFSQVFYPTRGILVWYDRKEARLKPLPGADDPRFVQTSAFWSPDGKYLIYSRTVASDPYPPGAPKPQYANDPREPQVQYDLYKIPFNDGRGGKPEPVVGASKNGMSNNFPKVSPDGKWIVFVQNKNGLLMRPDSRLFIVPFGGGKARLMKCNTSLMNSWHSFSPNGRWLAFSSKARSPYTQLLLTHIDDNGNDTPAILVENTTAANRAVNIPEFVNVPPGGLEKIDPQATEFYRLFNQAFELMEKNQMAEAIPVLQHALQQDPEDALAHYAMATALTGVNRERDAVQEYRKACELNPRNAPWLAHLAVSLAITGNLEEAIATWRKSLDIDPKNAGAESDLGTALFEVGRAQEGYQHLRKAIEMAPEFPDAHNHLGWELSKTGRLDESIEELNRAIALRPNSVEFHANLGYVLELRKDFPGAIAAFKKAVELSGGKSWRCFDMLADAYSKVGLSEEAVRSEQQALELASQQQNEKLEKRLRGNLERYKSEGARVQPQ
jgi:tetratricopeptide (TPR) repeat protein